MKKISLRRCVVTKEQLPKSDLLRIVKNKEGQVFPDHETEFSWGTQGAEVPYPRGSQDRKYR